VTLLLVSPVRDDVRGYLRAQLAADIAAVNAARPYAHPLVDIMTWSGAPLMVTPEPPALYVLPQTSGMRAWTWPGTFDQQHLLRVYVQVSDQDEETAVSDLEGYLAAVVQCFGRSINGAGTLPIGERGVQVVFGRGSGAEECITWEPAQMLGETYYLAAYLELLAWQSEVPA
jgi:hypothetical protein